jgi:hypothetical protein
VTIVLLLVGLAVAGVLVFFAVRHVLVSGGGKKRKMTPLETREVFLAGINQNSGCGEHRQKLIRQCKAGESLRLVPITEGQRDRNAIAVQRPDGRDIGFLPRAIATEMAEHIASGAPVRARILAIEPHEADNGEMLSGVRVALTPYRVEPA